MNPETPTTQSFWITFSYSSNGKARASRANQGIVSKIGCYTTGDFQFCAEIFTDAFKDEIRFLYTMFENSQPELNFA